MDSSKYRLNEKDWKSWRKNLLIFFAPSLVLGLTALQAGADYKYALGVVSAGLLNSLTDLLRKLIAENK